MSAGSFILDSATRGVLNQNYLYGDSPETIEATGLSSLGSLTVSVTSIVEVLVLAESDLGGLNASSTSNVTKLASAASEFGELNSEVISLVEHLSNAAANLGDLNSFAVPLTTRFVTAQSDLGSLSATANASSITENLANSNFGSLEANAISEVTPPIPPEPPTPSIGNGRANYSVPRLKKKVKPVIVKPEIPVIKETKPTEPVFKTVTASADTLAGIFSATAESQIDFSILEDEAELLLLI